MTPKEAERLRRLERQCARQKKNSCNQKKTKLKIARSHARARHRRKDFSEQVSHRLTTDYAGVAYEDLRVQKMTASAVGTVEEPGKNVAQKSGLNRAVLDVGWGMTRDRTRDKGPRRGCCVGTARARVVARVSTLPSCTCE
jgi:putative transposase